jgi:hypothetical protein
VEQNAEAAVAEVELIPKTILRDLLLTKEEVEAVNLPEVKAAVPKEVIEAAEVKATTNQEEVTQEEVEEAASVLKISLICSSVVKTKKEVTPAMT